ncbi:MAG: DUF4124 domain-containing protein [Halofilum sp. (in: g-proteobacteria)]
MRVLKSPALWGVALGLSLSGPLAAEAIYRWVDEDGVTHYSQQPPPSRDASRVRVNRPPDEEVQRERREMEETRERLESRREERRKGEQAAREEAEDRKRREQRCADLRSSLKRLTENRRLLVPDGEGDVRRMPEEERQQRADKRRRQIEEQCE